MIDPTVITAVRERIKKLLPYRRQVRPAAPTSFPPFVDSEMQRVSTSTSDIVTALQALDPILEALPDLGGDSFPEAPEDGTLYGRKNGDWEAVPSSPPGLSDAPADGIIYGRKDNDWVPAPTTGSDVEEAPEDGTPYCRQDGSWVPAPSDGGGGGGAYNQLYSWDRATDGNLPSGFYYVDVSAYDDILILYDRVTKPSGSSEQVNFSVDGGITYDTNPIYYVDLNNSGGWGFNDNALYSNGGSTGARMFIWNVVNLRSATSPKPIYGNRSGMYANNAAVTHIRIAAATGYNGGSIKVLGR